MNDEAYTKGLLDGRRALAEAWSETTGESVHAADFTGDYLRRRLDARLIERRTLADGAAPVVGLRVVTIRETAESWGLGHAHTDEVHEITSLLGGDTGLVECASQQFGVGMLRVASLGSEVTCRSCRGWRLQLAQMRVDGETYQGLRNELAAAVEDRDRWKRMAESASAAAIDDDSRCAVCGWPLAESAKEGCVRGNCPMWPRPVKLYAADRAARERAQMVSGGKSAAEVGG